MRPPRVATWLLDRLGPPSGPLHGDLREEWAKGRGRVWYWRPGADWGLSPVV